MFGRGERRQIAAGGLVLPGAFGDGAAEGHPGAVLADPPQRAAGRSVQIEAIGIQVAIAPGDLPLGPRRRRRDAHRHGDAGPRVGAGVAAGLGDGSGLVQFRSGPLPRPGPGAAGEEARAVGGGPQQVLALKAGEGDVDEPAGVGDHFGETGVGVALLGHRVDLGDDAPGDQETRIAIPLPGQSIADPPHQAERQGDGGVGPVSGLIGARPDEGDVGVVDVEGASRGATDDRLQGARGHAVPPTPPSPSRARMRSTSSSGSKGLVR